MPCCLRLCTQDAQNCSRKRRVSNGVLQRHVPHERHGSGTVVVVTNYAWEQDVVLENIRLGILGCPLRPPRPVGSVLGIRIEIVSEKNNVVQEV